MRAPVILKAQSAADFLAVLPSIVGTSPRQSLVLVAFSGKRTCGAMRFDLPKATNATVYKRIASQTLGTLCKIPGIDAVAVAVYTEDPIGSDGLPHADLTDVINRRIRHFGFELRQSLCQAGDGWGSYLDRELPAGGYPLSDILESPLLDSLPDDALPDDAELPSRVPDAPDAVRRRVEEGVAHYRELVDSLATKFASSLKDSGEDSVDDTLDDSVDAPDDSLDDSRDAPDDDDLPPDLDPLGDLPPFVEESLEWDDAAIDRYDALLLFVVQRPAMRDAIMLQWASDLPTGYRLHDSARRWAAGDRDAYSGGDQDLDGLMLGVGPRPDRERIHKGIRLLLALVGRVDNDLRVAPLCMLTWLYWAIGLNSRAGVYLDEAISIDPSYGLVEILATLLQNGVMPEWAFNEPAPGN